jgi:hypothetical protein
LGIFVKTLAVALGGAALGLFATSLSVERGFMFDAVQAGPWTGWPKAGTSEADPYAKAMTARTGEMPLGPAEGLTFVAREDSAGRRLAAACDYVVSGPMPTARYWTLTVMSPTGRLIDHPTQRYGLTSAEVLRAADGDFAVTVSRHARPGNWLPVAEDATYVLVLRLYDSANSANASTLRADELPSVVAERCA